MDVAVQDKSVPGGRRHTGCAFMSSVEGEPAFQGGSVVLSISLKQLRSSDLSPIRCERGVVADPKNFSV
jgi:hypothetical protein